MAERAKYSWTVTHPEYGTLRVNACTREEAILTAAERWGARFTKIAGECAVQKGGKAVTPRCRRCGRETAAGDLCLECRRILECARKEQDRAIRNRDRRARYAGK